MTLPKPPEYRRFEPVLDVVAMLYSLLMLIALVPSVDVTPIVQIFYFLVVPGYALVRLIDRPLGFIDRIALMLAISLGLLVGLIALFETFYPIGKFNESLIIPVVALVASGISLRSVLSRLSGA